MDVKQQIKQTKQTNEKNNNYLHCTPCFLTLQSLSPLLCSTVIPGEKRNTQLSEFQSSVNKLSDNVGALRKKVLVGIQLSAELSQRSVVRQCLDAINQQIPNVVEVLSGLPGRFSCCYQFYN